MASPRMSCLFCKETFEDREQLQIHFRKHGDPKFNQHAKSNKSVPRSDPNLSSEVSNDAAEMVGCDVCDDVFPTISKAITHKHKMHPDHDAKYFCPWCGKLFTMKHLYNKHITQYHTNEENAGSGFHCDYCNVDFFAVAAMIYHNKFFHRQDTELASIGYCKKMKHFDQEVLPIYYCPFCGEEYINKVNLHKHMGDEHIDENQSPDEVLRCPLCEAIFYHLDAYELHLTFHSDGDLYSEQNDIVKSITEFSLEAVPPLMEKVENETQEDAEANISSMGIENFLQQAMNESNDNDLSNSEGIPYKKKKHKKHKKSKKATITLDEFLSMNTDVFGDGVDLQVQGIEEVPSQVVAKQLRKPIMNIKKRPTVMQSKEIEKLRRQGIVIKKNPGKPNFVNMKVNSSVTSNTVTQKLPSLPQTPQNKSNLSHNDDVINRLMSQSNSQIKIVKKSLQNNSSSPSDTGTGPPDGNNDDNKETIDTVNQDDEHNNESTEIKLDKEENSTIQEEMEDVGEIDLSKPIPLKWKHDPPFGDAANETLKSGKNNQDNEASSQSALNVLKSISQHITVKPIVRSTGQINSEQLDETTEDKRDTVSHENKTNNKNLDVLKRLGNLTVKSVNQTQNQSPGSPKTKAIPLPSGSPLLKDTGEKADENQGSPGANSPSTFALRNISKHITVKSPLNKASQIVRSADDSEDTDMVSSVNSDRVDMSNKNIKRIQENSTFGKKPEFKSSEILKNINRNITIKAPNKSAIISDESHIEDEKMENSEEDIKETEISTNLHLDSKTDMQSMIQNQSQSKALGALKNLSKNITIKAPNRSPVVTNKIYSEDDNMDNFEEEGSETEVSRNLHHSSKKEVSKSPNLVQNQSKSLDALKNLSKHITIKPPNKSLVATSNTDLNEEDEDLDQDECEAEEKECDDETFNDVQMHQNSNKVNQSPKNPLKTSLNALKNLSKHITIKSPHNLNSQAEDTGSEQEEINEDQDDVKSAKHSSSMVKTNEKSKEFVESSGTKEIAHKSNSLDFLRNISKHITIKSPNKKIVDDNVDQCKSASKILAKGNQNPESKNPEIRKVTHNTPVTSICRKAEADLDKIVNSQIVKKQSLDIMKKFPNITAKSLSSTKSVKQQETYSNQSVSIGKGNTLQKCTKTEHTSEVIETYNIDDSEDEETHITTSEDNLEPSPDKHKLFNRSMDTLNAIKKLNSNITVKPKQKVLPESSSPLPDDNLPDDEIEGTSDEPDNLSSLTRQVNAKLQETLNNISKNICITPSGSPKNMIKSPNVNQLISKKNPSLTSLKNMPNSQPSSPQRNMASTLKNISEHVSVKSSKISNKTENNEINYNSNEDSDLDPDTNVKITEVENDCSSNDEAISKLQNRLHNTASNVIVQTPSEDESDDFDNIEKHIKPSIISKTAEPEGSASSENQLVKYGNQNPRLKSMQNFSFDDEDECAEEDETPVHNQKAINKGWRNDNIANMRQGNQNIAKSSQIVNKEVTVQTFQTETVVEEITTTVTKTIRTVNQAVRQETRGQTTNVPRIRPQFQGTSNMPQTTNYRGIQVRQTRPTIGVPVRHSGPQTRPGIVRPNQSVPLRSNVPRPTNRMPVVRQNLQAPNAQKVTRPMKMAPNAIVASAKRPSQEPPGHFSCFKKPKESLIPVPDIPTSMTINNANNTGQQVKMSTQMTKSNFSTTTKVIKGNSVMTSTQNKSAMSCSTEQKLSNMSGMKIVKTSQKQAMQVEERSEVSAPNRSSAMETIERLQRQGLLIKKPRVDDSVHDDYNMQSDEED